VSCFVYEDSDLVYDWAFVYSCSDLMQVAPAGVPSQSAQNTG